MSPFPCNSVGENCLMAVLFEFSEVSHPSQHDQGGNSPPPWRLRSMRETGRPELVNWKVVSELRSLGTVLRPKDTFPKALLLSGVAEGGEGRGDWAGGLAAVSSGAAAPLRGWLRGNPALGRWVVSHRLLLFLPCVPRGVKHSINSGVAGPLPASVGPADSRRGEEWEGTAHSLCSDRTSCPVHRGLCVGGSLCPSTGVPTRGHCAASVGVFVAPQNSQGVQVRAPAEGVGVVVPDLQEAPRSRGAGPPIPSLLAPGWRPMTVSVIALHLHVLPGNGTCKATSA